MTQPIEYTHCSRQFAEWASPAHDIMQCMSSSAVVSPCGSGS